MTGTRLHDLPGAGKQILLAQNRLVLPHQPLEDRGVPVVLKNQMRQVLESRLHPRKVGPA